MPLHSITPVNLFRIVAVITVAVSFIVTSAAFNHYGSPFQLFDALLVCAIYVSPLTLLICRRFSSYIDLIGTTAGETYYASLEKSGMQMNTKTFIIGKTVAHVLTALYVTFFLTALSININIVFDTSSPITYEAPIIDKGIVKGKSNLPGSNYHVIIDKPEFVQLPFELNFKEKIAISKTDWESADTNVSSIILSTHTGLLGIPWYSAQHDFRNLRKKVTNRQPVSQEKISEACTWAGRFNSEIDIEKITPNDYRRDFWPNGQPRSVEPLVNNQVHGIGHYTFANGALYGDIPWRHGNKHGTFTLYHEDGTRDQTLSYKDGHLFGINQWHSPNGEVKEQWLYLDDNTHYSVVLCQLKLR